MSLDLRIDCQQGQKFVASSLLQYLLWGPLSPRPPPTHTHTHTHTHAHAGTHARARPLCTKGTQSSMKLSAYLHLGPRLELRRDMPPLPYTSSRKDASFSTPIFLPFQRKTVHHNCQSLCTNITIPRMCIGGVEVRLRFFRYVSFH
jgi:hypothetical protein